MRYRLLHSPNFIILLGLIFFVPPISSLWCYESETPHLSKSEMKECRDDEVCFVEFFINNMSGTPVHRYDRFCTQRAQCVRHNIPMNHDVEIIQLALASQDAFYTENANMTKDEGKEYISSTWFRCCDTDACNSIDLHSVRGRFHVWPSLNHSPHLASTSLLLVPILFLALL